MIRTVNAISDRLLGLVVPRVTAHADPCGREYYEYCGCYSGSHWHRFCCSKGGCGSCYVYAICRW